jgi:hypothetical protein
MVIIFNEEKDILQNTYVDRTNVIGSALSSPFHKLTYELLRSLVSRCTTHHQLQVSYQSISMLYQLQFQAIMMLSRHHGDHVTKSTANLRITNFNIKYL